MQVMLPLTFARRRKDTGDDRGQENNHEPFYGLTPFPARRKTHQKLFYLAMQFTLVSFGHFLVL